MEMDYEEGDQLEWRDTYFILFQQSGRPALTPVEAAAPAEQPRGEATADQLKKLLRADARLDVMHFERVSAADAFNGDDDQEFGGEAVDPASLLNVGEALAKLTKGLPIDPASGAIL